MIRPQRRRNLSSDVPWFAGALILAGIIATVVHVTVDLLLHRHRAG